MREYLLIDQDRPAVDHFTRRRDAWTKSSATSLASRVSLRCIKVDLPLRETYRGAF